MLTQDQALAAISQLFRDGMASQSKVTPGGQSWRFWDGYATAITGDILSVVGHWRGLQWALSELAREHKSLSARIESWPNKRYWKGAAKAYLDAITVLEGAE